MNTIFSPILNSSQSAFDYNTQEYIINFTIPDKVTVSEIKHIDIKITLLNNNTSIVNNTIYPDYIIYKEFISLKDGSGSNRSITINSNDLQSGHWKPGTYYKVQLRFGINELWGENDFAEWKLTLIKENGFSEWSNIMIIKAIQPPAILLLNSHVQQSNTMVINSAIGTEFNAQPLFEGVFEHSSDEPIADYRFELYDVTQSVPKLIDDTGWLTHNANRDFEYNQRLINEDFDIDTPGILRANGGDAHRFPQILKYGNQIKYVYRAFYSVRTVNGYEKRTNGYDFSVIYPIASDSLPIYLTAIGDNEEGLVHLSIESKDNTDVILSGSYVISRSNILNNYEVWEDIQFFNWTTELFDPKGRIVYTDYTVESGISYKYGIQSVNTYGIRNTRQEIQFVKRNTENKAIEIVPATITVDFQYSYLYYNGTQLKLKYDNTISSFKHIVLILKLDTLGGKYPIITRNSAAYYGEFPIGGLISMHSDEKDNFFKFKLILDKSLNIINNLSGYYYNDELIVPKDKFMENCQRISTEGAIPLYDDNKILIGYEIVPSRNNTVGYFYNINLNDNNTFIERKFREKVEEFLNDGKPKLYKSPTEGNIIVGITNVSMTPNQLLSRMIYSFTSTAYEVMEYNYLNLLDYGILDIGNTYNEGFLSMYLLGLLNSIDNNISVFNDNIETSTNIVKIILELIANMETDTVHPELYQYKLKEINSISIEPFPDLNLKGEIKEIKDTIADLLSKGVLEDAPKIIELLYKLQKYEYIEQLVTSRKLPYILFTINDLKYFIGPNQYYELNNFEKIYPNQDNLIITIDKIDIGNSILVVPPVLINYKVLGQIEENTIATITSTTSAKTWGQVNALFTSDQNEYNSYYAFKNNTNPNDDSPLDMYFIEKGSGEKPIPNILNIIEERIKLQVSKEWLKEGNYFDSYDETEEAWYCAALPDTLLKFLGFEKLIIEADKPTEFTMGYIDSGILRQTRNFIVGSTSLYRMDNVLIEEALSLNLTYKDNLAVHCMVDYEMQIMILKRGASQANV